MGHFFFRNSINFIWEIEKSKYVCNQKVTYCKMAKEIKIERIYPKPIEQVWAAISTSEALSAWLMPNDFILKKGHQFQFRAPKQAGFDGVIKCEVLDFDIPNLLVYSWQGRPLKEPTQVRWQLETVQEGTKLTFTHSGFKGMGGFFVRLILGNGWQGLLKKKILNYLNA
jgi:uncharacterized protein YndB with AHSA1/START domain